VRQPDDIRDCLLTLQVSLKASTSSGVTLSAIVVVFLWKFQGYIPRYGRLREFACIPPPLKERLHCTIIRHGDDTSGGYYTLYLEYLGGLIPLLKGKRASKLHPDFLIFDPQAKALPLRLGMWCCSFHRDANTYVQVLC